ncbi:hypothetical protein NQZ68_019115 [Dissostichus eleginoides]|nr:hypothetical protein NQZ68_019115 [Dissostichus eleginoides]
MWPWSSSSVDGGRWQCEMRAAPALLNYLCDGVAPHQAEAVRGSEQDCACGDTYHPKQKQSHACPEFSMTLHRPTCRLNKGKVLLSDENAK